MNSEQLANKVLLGDAGQVLDSLPDDFFQCVVTSPPYFGMRKYSDDPAEIGREENVEEYVQRLVEVLVKVRRVVREDGLLWLNLGDSYIDKCLQGVPWRVALKLQEFGWILRSDIIWHKPNAMPSSTRDRPTVDHEYIFMFAKNKKYFYDADAIREPHVTFSEKSRMRGGRRHFGKRDGTPENGKNAGNSNLHDARWDQAFHPKGRNKRTVWSIPLSKYRDAHFAVYPTRLVETCLLASTQRGDFILDPFTGSGTTGVVSKKYGRLFVGIELTEKYQKMAQARIDGENTMLL